MKVAATWELPKTHKIRLGKEKQVSQILTQFEYSNFTSISMYIYMSQAPLFIVWEGWNLVGKFKWKLFENGA